MLLNNMNFCDCCFFTSPTSVARYNRTMNAHFVQSYCSCLMCQCAQSKHIAKAWESVIWAAVSNSLHPLKGCEWPLFGINNVQLYLLFFTAISWSTLGKNLEDWDCRFGPSCLTLQSNSKEFPYGKRRKNRDENAMFTYKIMHFENPVWKQTLKIHPPILFLLSSLGS